MRKIESPPRVQRQSTMPGFAGQAEKTFNGTPGRASIGYIEIGTSLRTWFPAKFAIQRRFAESHTDDRCICKTERILPTPPFGTSNSRLYPAQTRKTFCLTLRSVGPIIAVTKVVLLQKTAGVQTCLRVWWWLCEPGQARNRAALSKSVRYMRGQVCAPAFVRSGHIIRLLQEY
jgi:hypothetical protein